MNVMLFFLREARFMTALFCVGVLVPLFAASFTKSFVLPGGEIGAGLLVQWWALGLIVGVANAVWDEARGTEAFSHHRRVGVVEQQLSANVASAISLLLTGLVPLAFYSIVSRWTQPNAPIADWSRLSALMALATISVSSYAAAGFAASLNVAALHRFFVGIVVCAGVFVTSRDLASPAPDELAASPIVFIGFQLAATVLLLWAWRRNVVFGRDVDRATPWRGSLLQGGIVLLAFAPSVGAIAMSVQKRALMILSAYYPQIAELGDGRVVLLSNHVDGVDGFAVVDDDHRSVEPPRNVDGRRGLFSPWSLRIRARDPIWERFALGHGLTVDREVGFEGASTRVASENGGLAYFYRSTGLVDVRWTADDRLRAPVRQTLGRDRDARPFAPTTAVLSRGRAGPAFLLDPTDESVWELRVGDRDAAISRVPLSPGDRVVRSLSREGELLIEREGRLHCRVGASWVALDEADEASLRRVARATEWFDAALDRVLASGADPIEFDVEVETPSQPGGVARHAYRPRSEVERKQARIALAAALLRPPLALLVHHVEAPPRSDYRRWTTERAYVRDPLVAGGKRPWLVVAAFAVSGAFALLAFVRLRRFGAEPPRAVGWAVLVALFGPAGLVVHWVLETSRAWRWRESSFAEAVPAPLIQS